MVGTSVKYQGKRLRPRHRSRFNKPVFARRDTASLGLDCGETWFTGSASFAWRRLDTLRLGGANQRRKLNGDCAAEYRVSTRMLSHELASGLISYGVGPKMRALRLKRKMGLVELGKHTGLSPALLSKIERSKLFPTLPTLLRVATVFSVGLEFFFVRDQRKPAPAVTRRGERGRFPEQPDLAKPGYVFESLDFPAMSRKLNAYHAEFRPLANDELRSHAHEGAEFIYVVGGRLSIGINDAEVELGPGDSVYFDSGSPHSYRRLGDLKCTAVVVTVPDQ